MSTIALNKGYGSFWFPWGGVDKYLMHMKRALSNLSSTLAVSSKGNPFIILSNPMQIYLGRLYFSDMQPRKCYAQ